MIREGLTLIRCKATKRESDGTGGHEHTGRVRNPSLKLYEFLMEPNRPVCRVVLILILFSNVLLTQAPPRGNAVLICFDGEVTDQYYESR